MIFSFISWNPFWDYLAGFHIVWHSVSGPFPWGPTLLPLIFHVVYRLSSCCLFCHQHGCLGKDIRSYGQKMISCSERPTLGSFLCFLKPGCPSVSEITSLSSFVMNCKTSFSQVFVRMEEMSVLKTPRDELGRDLANRHCCYPSGKPNKGGLR